VRFEAVQPPHDVIGGLRIRSTANKHTVLGEYDAVAAVRDPRTTMSHDSPLAQDETRTRWVAASGGADVCVCGPAATAVFERIANEFAHAVLDGVGVVSGDRLPIIVMADRPERVLSLFLEELCALAETECFVTRRVERLVLDGTHLRAAVSGMNVASAQANAEIVSAEVRMLAEGSWVARARLLHEVSGDARLR
jgi:SHS2 domain-containing protein